MGLGLFGWRLVFTKVLRVQKIRGTIAIIGMQKVGKLVAEELFRKKHLGLQVAYFVGPERGEVTLSYGNPRKITIPVVSPEATLSLVKAEGISRILIAGPERGQRFPAHDLVTLRLSGIPIEDCHTFYERLMSKIFITDLRPSWILLSNRFPAHGMDHVYEKGAGYRGIEFRASIGGAGGAHHSHCDKAG